MTFVIPYKHTHMGWHTYFIVFIDKSRYITIHLLKHESIFFEKIQHFKKQVEAETNYKKIKNLKVLCWR
jgi:hypothetical protein